MAVELDLAQTIVAISSGLSPAERGIVRLSGPDTAAVLTRLIAASDEAQHWLQHVRYAASVECSLNIDETGRTLAARLYYWPNHRSFTGEASAELHVCGSLPLLEMLVSRAVACGARLAERGEFTLRSFLAGKVDLLQAEAVLGVIQAENRSDLELALEQLGGNLSQPVRELRLELLQMTAHLEAGLDFVEEDIEFITAAELSRGIETIRLQLHSIGQQFARRGTGARNLEVLLVGPPNAGKSSLFNALIGEMRAIVSAVAGTTRDVVTATVQREGLQFQLVDTAGLEDVDNDTPRALAQQQLAERLHSADLLLICIDTSHPDAAQQMQEHLDRFRTLATPCVLVGTKQDQLADKSSRAGLSNFDVLVSVHDGHALEQLQKSIATELGKLTSTSMAEALQRTSIRCLAAIDQAVQSLERAQQLIRDAEGEELVATELRCALDELAAMIGEVHSDTILGEIFSRFCIGK